MLTVLLLVTVQPLADVVADYSCYDRDKECYDLIIHCISPPFVGGITAVIVYHINSIVFSHFFSFFPLVSIKKELH